jgi:hypothetical protein
MTNKRSTSSIYLDTSNDFVMGGDAAKQKELFRWLLIQANCFLTKHVDELKHR